jgi:hypothetical protein
MPLDPSPPEESLMFCSIGRACERMDGRRGAGGRGAAEDRAEARAAGVRFREREWREGGEEEDV